jgi:hypothetical protein
MTEKQPLTDPQYNAFKALAYALAAIGTITLPVSLVQNIPYFPIISAILLIIGAIGSGIINYMTKPDTVVAVDNSAKIAQAIVTAIQTIKTEQANPTPQPKVDPAVIIAAMEEAAKQAIDAYKASQAVPTA